MSTSGYAVNARSWMIDAKGAVGCTLSHIRAWKALRDNANASYAVWRLRTFPRRRGSTSVINYFEPNITRQ